MKAYGKIVYCMNSTPSQETQKRPSLIECIRSGFDVIANHIYLVIFPLLLDLFLWLGPHYRIKSLVDRSLAALDQVMTGQEGLPPDLVQVNSEIARLFAERYNLLSILRTQPVGIPSLMSGRLPIQTPLGTPRFIELTSTWNVFMAIVLTACLGLILGALYYLLVAQLVAGDQIDWTAALRDWPQASLRSLGLSMFFFGVLVAVTVPFSCLISLLTVSGLAVSQLSFLLYGIIMAWWLFPLAFAAHGIFLYREKLWNSLRRSVRMTRSTFALTALMVMLILLASEGLDLLWNTPQENSWLMLLGIAGHGFVTSALLATSFVYYREINHWLQFQRRAGLAI